NLQSFHSLDLLQLKKVRHERSKIKEKSKKTWYSGTKPTSIPHSGFSLEPPCTTEGSVVHRRRADGVLALRDLDRCGDMVEVRLLLSVFVSSSTSDTTKDPWVTTDTLSLPWELFGEWFSFSTSSLS